MIRLDTFGFQGTDLYKSLDYEVAGNYTNDIDNFEFFSSSIYETWKLGERYKDIKFQYHCIINTWDSPHIYHI